jgi:phenylalanyl-tRNA synthetase beta chain
MHPRLQRKYELPAGPILFELDLAPLLRTRRPHAQPVSKFPPVRRDIAIVIDESVSAQTLLDTLEAARSSVVSTVRVFDGYRVSGVPQGKKSLAILVLMQDTQRTLTDAEIEENVTRLVGVLQREFGATLRQ